MVLVYKVACLVDGKGDQTLGACLEDHGDGDRFEDQACFDGGLEERGEIGCIVNHCFLHIWVFVSYFSLVTFQVMVDFPSY